jgi:polyisoprenoid-binding protein YceI
MKLRIIRLSILLAAATVILPLGAAERLGAKSGSRMRIEGTSNIHDWQVEGSLIGGFIEVADNFPLEPGSVVKPGKVDVKCEAFVTTHSLTSREKDGDAYSTKMDDVMYEKLLVETNKRITFHLTEFVLTETAKDKSAPYVYEAKGQLAVAGVTNDIAFPVNVLPQGGEDKKIKISGTAQLKMTQFKIQPPSPKFLPIKTGDDVKIIFDWIVGPAKKSTQ